MSVNSITGWEMAAGTDIGLIRVRNEDALGIFPNQGIVILSDGMGGHRAGDVASSMAVDVIASLLVPNNNERQADDGSPVSSQTLADSLHNANTAILTAARQQPACLGMGATVVVASFHEQHFIAAHVGDSRLYRFSKGQLEQLTIDHTLAERYMSQGFITRQQVNNWTGKNILLKALGIDEMITPDITEGPVRGDDLFLLCSDGLTDAVADVDIEKLLQQDDEGLQQKVEQLITAANNNGGPDNVSVILVRRSTS
jgi:protein phosphatase